MKSLITFGLCLILICFSCKRQATDSPSVPTPEEEPLYIGQTLPTNNVLLQIAIGSCNRQDLDQRIWQDINDEKPDLWIWLGDNVYGDTEDMARLEEKYVQQKYSFPYKFFRRDTPIIGIWDDHDYGVNDGDRNYPMRAESQRLMFDFLDVPKDSPFRTQQGAYQSYIFGSAGKAVKVILLDARYFRHELERNDGYQRYKPNLTGDILGEAQWTWLEQELTNSDANIHLIASGIQIIPEEHGFEKWANFPTARKRLLDLIARTQPNNPLLLSGDRHISEFSRLHYEGLPDSLYEFTSSGLTHSYTNFTSEPNKHRIGDVVSDQSYGLISVEWTSEEPSIRLEMKGIGKKLLQELEIK